MDINKRIDEILKEIDQSTHGFIVVSEEDISIDPERWKTIQYMGDKGYIDELSSVTIT